MIEQQQNTRKSPGEILGFILVFIFIVAIIILLKTALDTYSNVQIELENTPTPVPTKNSTALNIVVQNSIDPNAPTPTPTPLLLKNGTEGDEVKKIQQRLADLGYYFSTIDGQFGKGTKNAVVWFQNQHNLDADGIAGPTTNNLLFSDNAQIAIQTPTPEPTATPSPTPIASSYYDPEKLPFLINKTYPLSEDAAEPTLVKMIDVCDDSLVHMKYSDTYADPIAVEALKEMLTVAHRDGLDDWQISAAYRSIKYQKAIFDARVSDYIEKGLDRTKAISATQKTVADPGTSEHHIGLAFDVTVPGKYFSDTKQSKWIAENCWDYGFILRYTEDKEDITGFLAEAWHIRFVGLPHSIIMRDENLCLEEYLMEKGAI